MKQGMRGAGINLPADPEKVGLPLRPFLFTLDQVATMLHIEELALKRDYLYFEGRTTGVRSRHLMIARNIAPPEKSPEWRVAERELLRWLKIKGFKYYDRAVVID